MDTVPLLSRQNQPRPEGADPVAWTAVFCGNLGEVIATEAAAAKPPSTPQDQKMRCSRSLISPSRHSLRPPKGSASLARRESPTVHRLRTRACPLADHRIPSSERDRGYRLRLAWVVALRWFSSRRGGAPWYRLIGPTSATMPPGSHRSCAAAEDRHSSTFFVYADVRRPNRSDRNGRHTSSDAPEDYSRPHKGRPWGGCWSLGSVLVVEFAARAVRRRGHPSCLERERHGVRRQRLDVGRIGGGEHCAQRV